MPEHDPASLYPPLPTDLRACCWRGDLEGARRAVAGGERIDARHATGYPALFLATARGHLAVMRFLLDAGADPDIPDHIGVTPLMGACYEDRVDAAALLLARGANVNARTAEQATPLMFAAMYGRRALVDLYLASGADRWATDHRGHTPGGFARVQGHLELGRHLEAWTAAAGGAAPAQRRDRPSRAGRRDR